MNSVTLIGNLGADPEVRTTKNGTKVANLRVATTRFGPNKERETDWHSVVVWGEHVDITSKLKRGDRVAVIGELRTRQWQDQKGDNRYSTEVVVFGFSGGINSIASQPRNGDSQKANGRTSAEINDQIPF